MPQFDAALYTFTDYVRQGKSDKAFDLAERGILPAAARRAEWRESAINALLPCMGTLAIIHGARAARLMQDMLTISISVKNGAVQDRVMDAAFRILPFAAEGNGAPDKSYVAVQNLFDALLEVMPAERKLRDIFKSRACRMLVALETKVAQSGPAVPSPMQAVFDHAALALIEKGTTQTESLKLRRAVIDVFAAAHGADPAGVHLCLETARGGEKEIAATARLLLRMPTL